MKDTIKKIKKVRLIIVAILSITIIYFLLPDIGSFLNFKTTIRHADAIIILGGDDERLTYGIKLYELNYSDKIILSGVDYSGPIGISQKDVILEDRSSTTYENAEYSREIMLQNKFTSAIVVSSPYHMRRASWLFSRVFKNDNITLLYSPVDDSWFIPEKWWINKNGIDTVLKEYGKFIYYELIFLKGDI